MQHKTPRVLIAGYARTPFAKFTGVLAQQSATTLGAHAAQAALRRADIRPEDVEMVIAGQVLQAGAGQNPSRQTAVKTGVPLDVPAVTLNAVCLSGMEAVAQAARMIRGGEVEVVLAVGQESMSLAPHLTRLRAGVKFGASGLEDSVEGDGLRDAFEHIAMGALTDRGNEQLGLDRHSQDQFAARSHQRAESLQNQLNQEIEPFTIQSKRGETVIGSDDGIRSGVTVEALGALRPAFDPEGSVTAGNASQITDGAAALVLVSDAAAERLGTIPIAQIDSSALVAGPDVHLHAQPARAISAVLAKRELDVSDLNVIEVNEAFAAVCVQSALELGVDPSFLNARGGAIALGHPIGASGARLVGTLATQLTALGKGALGAAGICGGGGQGSSMLLRAL